MIVDNINAGGREKSGFREKILPRKKKGKKMC